jgi:primosomal protein N' (replication factor Y)
LVPVALNQAHSLRAGRGMELKPGDVVCVPPGPREVVAVVAKTPIPIRACTTA